MNRSAAELPAQEPSPAPRGEEPATPEEVVQVASRPPAVVARPHPVIVFLLVLCVAGGLALRLWNLGSLGLIADEGHQALAVEGILEHGVPLVPSGNIYMRGLPFLYTEALVARFVGVGEWALRFPAALFGALAILVTYMLATRLFDRRVGVLAAALLALSVWELEMARYARMYTLLQLAFVLGAFGFVRGFLDDSRPWRWITILVMGLAIVTHQLGLLVLLLFLIPACLDNEVLPPVIRGRRRYILLVPVTLLGGVWLGYHRLVASLMRRIADAPDRLDGHQGIVAGVTDLLRAHFLVPELTMPLDLLGSDPAAVRVAAGLAAGLALLIVIAGVRQAGRRLRALLALGIVVAAAMNLFAVALGLTAAALLVFGGGLGELRRAPWSFALFGVAVFAAYWTVYLLGHPEALDPGWGEPRTLAQVFTGYPPFGERVLRWFVAGWPWFTTLVIAGLAVCLVGFLAHRRQTNLLCAGFLILAPLLAVSFGAGFHEVRYHFHVYPFMVILFAAVLSLLARGVVGGADVLLAGVGRRVPARRMVEGLLVLVVALGCTRDQAPEALLGVVRRDYTTHKDPYRAALNWPLYARFHQDHAGPARYVRERLAPGDRVVCFGPTYWTSIYLHYIGQLDYVVTERGAGQRRGDQILHHVTGVPCVSTVAELEAMLERESAHRVWILGDVKLLGDSPHFSAEMKERLRELATNREYLGRDLVTTVSSIAPAPGGG